MHRTRYNAFCPQCSSAPHIRTCRREAHEREIILYEAAVKALKATGVSKLPNVAALQAEYEKLREQKEALYADYGRLKKQVKEYDVIKQNIDSILKIARPSEREKEQ